MGLWLATARGRFHSLENVKWKHQFLETDTILIRSDFVMSRSGFHLFKALFVFSAQCYSQLRSPTVSEC